MNNKILLNTFRIYLEESNGIASEFKCQTQKGLNGYQRVIIKSGNRTLTINYNPQTDETNVCFEMDEEIPKDEKERIRDYIRELYI